MSFIVMEAAAHLFISKTLIPQWAYFPPHPLQLKACISVCEKISRGKSPSQKPPNFMAFFFLIYILKHYPDE